MAPQVEIDQTIFVATKIKHKKTCKITWCDLEGNKTATLVSRGPAPPAISFKTDAAADVCDYICRHRCFSQQTWKSTLWLWMWRLFCLEVDHRAATTTRIRSLCGFNDPDRAGWLCELNGSGFIGYWLAEPHPRHWIVEGLYWFTQESDELPHQGGATGGRKGDGGLLMLLMEGCWLRRSCTVSIFSRP